MENMLRYFIWITKTLIVIYVSESIIPSNISYFDLIIQWTSLHTFMNNNKIHFMNDSDVVFSNLSGHVFLFFVSQKYRIT